MSHTPPVMELSLCCTAVHPKDESLALQRVQPRLTSNRVVLPWSPEPLLRLSHPHSLLFPPLAQQAKLPLAAWPLRWVAPGFLLNPYQMNSTCGMWKKFGRQVAGLRG